MLNKRIIQAFIATISSWLYVYRHPLHARKSCASYIVLICVTIVLESSTVVVQARNRCLLNSAECFLEPDPTVRHIPFIFFVMDLEPKRCICRRQWAVDNFKYCNNIAVLNSDKAGHSASLFGLSSIEWQPRLINELNYQRWIASDSDEGLNINYPPQNTAIYSMPMNNIDFIEPMPHIFDFSIFFVHKFDIRFFEQFPNLIKLRMVVLHRFEPPRNLFANLPNLQHIVYDIVRTPTFSGDEETAVVASLNLTHFGNTPLLRSIKISENSLNFEPLEWLRLLQNLNLAHDLGLYVCSFNRPKSFTSIFRLCGINEYSRRDLKVSPTESCAKSAIHTEPSPPLSRPFLISVIESWTKILFRRWYSCNVDNFMFQCPEIPALILSFLALITKLNPPPDLTHSSIRLKQRLMKSSYGLLVDNYLWLSFLMMAITIGVIHLLRLTRQRNASKFWSENSDLVSRLDRVGQNVLTTESQYANQSVTN